MVPISFESFASIDGGCDCGCGCGRCGFFFLGGFFAAGCGSAASTSVCCVEEGWEMDRGFRFRCRDASGLLPEGSVRIWDSIWNGRKGQNLAARERSLRLEFELVELMR